MPHSEQLLSGSAPSDGGGDIPDPAAGLDADGLQRRIQEVTDEGATRQAEFSQFHMALEDQAANLAMYKEESRALTLQVARMKQAADAQLEEASAKFAEEAIEQRLRTMRQTLELQRRTQKAALRAAGEESYNMQIQLDQLRLAHADQSFNASEARDMAEERLAEVQAAMASIAVMREGGDIGADAGGGGESAAAERDDALRLAQALRAECAAKESKLRELSQEAREKERLAAEAAVETKQGEERLAEVRRRIVELESEGQEAV